MINLFHKLLYIGFFLKYKFRLTRFTDIINAKDLDLILDQNFLPCQVHNTNDTCVGCPPGTCNIAEINSKHFSYHNEHICMPIHQRCDPVMGKITFIFL